jgi:hypothetical protein
VIRCCVISACRCSDRGRGEGGGTPRKSGTGQIYRIPTRNNTCLDVLYHPLFHATHSCSAPAKLGTVLGRYCTNLLLRCQVHDNFDTSRNIRSLWKLETCAQILHQSPHHRLACRILGPSDLQSQGTKFLTEPSVALTPSDCPTTTPIANCNP